MAIFMGIFDWLSRKNETLKESTLPNITLTIHTEEIETAYNNFSGEIAGSSVRAEVPIKAKTECEKLLRKPNRTYDENEYLHDNYWVNVYYKGERHGYHGINDVWTHSVRSLPEYLLLYDWIYSILGKKKAEINGNITTVKTWEENNSNHANGTYSSISVKVSFKPKGFILTFLIKDYLRWEDKASYNTKTGQGDFPFYYSNVQGKIIEWGKSVFEENKLPSRSSK